MHHTRLVLESHPLCQDVLWILDGREAQWGLLDLDYQKLLWVTDAVSKTFDDNKQSMCKKMQWSLYLAVRGHLCLLSGLDFQSKRSRCRTRVPGLLWVEPELPESSDNRINQAPQIPLVHVSRCQGAVTQTLLHGVQEVKHTGRKTNTPTPLRYPSCPVDKNKELNLIMILSPNKKSQDCFIWMVAKALLDSMFWLVAIASGIVILNKGLSEDVLQEDAFSDFLLLNVMFI